MFFFWASPRFCYIHPLSTSVIISLVTDEKQKNMEVFQFELRHAGALAEEVVSWGVSNVLLTIPLDFRLYPYIPRYKLQIKPKVSCTEQSHSLNLTLLGPMAGFHRCPSQSPSQFPEARSAKQFYSVSGWRIKSYLCKQHKHRFSLTNIQKIENSCDHCVQCPAE